MSSTTGEVNKLPSLISKPQCFRFSLVDIQSATKDFDDEQVIGHGGFGKVYKGCICFEETSHVVAIKRLDPESNQGAQEFRAEIEMLSKLRHCHLVSLIGFCDDNKEMILVYEYMPHGTLYHHLHKAHTHLSWVQRLKIAIGAGRGLDYLHTGVGTQEGVIHRDVKSSNILLDEKWAAKISDFGLSKIGPTNQSSSYVNVSVSVKGTFGYLDPEYFYTRKVTRKTDVYAFGVVLFELLSGRLAVDERNDEDQCSLVRWAQKCVKERKFNQMVDFKIRGTLLPKCLRGFTKVADRCVSSILKERPTIAEVVVSLQAFLELQQRNDNPAEPSGVVTGFTWKIHKYLVSSSKQNSDQRGKILSESPENNISKFPPTNKEDGDETDQGEFNDWSPWKLAITYPIRFSYDELRNATEDFGNRTCLSKKIHVSVYKGWISKSTFLISTILPVVVKLHKLYINSTKLELEKLKELSHPNVVKLIGYCFQDQRIFLVYEFMPNGNFEDLLDRGGVKHLPLTTKVKISVGIARGIVYLHNTEYCHDVCKCQLHRDKILLDKDFTAKLSGYDFTLLERGCYLGILQPQDKRADYPSVADIGQLPTDLSGFTMLFAEVLTGRRISNKDAFQKIDNIFIQDGKISLVDIAKSCFEICIEVDSELKILRILEEYEKYIPACQKLEFTKPPIEYFL